LVHTVTELHKSLISKAFHFDKALASRCSRVDTAHELAGLDVAAAGGFDRERGNTEWSISVESAHKPGEPSEL